MTNATRTVIDGKLQVLRDAAERVGQNLVELETDPSRELLDGSKLAGESAARWSSASGKLSELWQWNGLLQAHVEKATKLRDGKRFDELAALLEGPSIELSSTDVPLAQRTLLGDSQLADRCSADVLLRRMSATFDEVKTVVAGIGGAWEALIPRVDAARAQLTQCQQLASELGESARRDLEAAAQQLASVSATTTSDPLAVRVSEIDMLTRSLAEIRADLDSIAIVKREFDGRLAGARELLERLRGLAEEGRAAHEELVVKIAAPTAPAALQLREDLDGQLARIAALGTRGAWRDARHELDQWSARTGALLDDARRILRANREPIESRNQLRSLLDAYQVKAKALGMIEDPDLAGLYAQAHDALYTAPTDLALVGALVRRYQQTLNGTPETQEELR
jgi:hypothetical protein